MTKAELRHFIRAEKTRQLKGDDAWSSCLCRDITAHQQWQQAECVLLYHALPDEPRLDSLYEQALSMGKQVLLPVVDGSDLVLKRYEGPASLREGAFHIMEPTGEPFPVSRYAEIDLAVIPGMAFDRAGHRLGRGKGYYDRLLPRLPKAYKLGVCFPFQLLDSIPCEEHDVVMDDVVAIQR